MKQFTVIKGFYHGQIDVIDAWYRLIDHQTAFLTGVSGTLADFDLGGKTIVDLPFLSEDLAQGEKQADEMVSDQKQTLEQIFSDIEDIIPLSPFSSECFDAQMIDLHQKRIETIDAVNAVDDSLTKEYQYIIPEQNFLMALIDQLLRATAQGGEVSTIHFDANAYRNSEVYKNSEEAEANTATYLANKQEQAHARELKDRSWNEVLWDGTKTFTGEMTGYYDSIRALTGIDPVTGVVYTAGQRVAYAGLAAAGFIPIVGWAGRAIKGGKGIYTTVEGVKAANTSLDMYKTANALSSVKNVEMGIYGLAAANGVSEYITGKDVFGTELNAEQRSASLAQGIFASIPFVPSTVSKGNYISKQTMQKISNMNLTGGPNTFQPFSQNPGALQKWLGNSHVQPAFAGNVPEVPIRVMDTKNINKKLDVVYSKRLGSGNVGKGTGNTPNKVNYGEQYTKVHGKKALKSNIEYKTKEGYHYKTDSEGRISNLEATLQLGKADRNNYAQRTVGREDRLPNDDGGYLIASIFKGSGEIDNLVPMNATLNRKEYKALETSWKKTLASGKEVTVKVKPIYLGNSSRPNEFKVSYTIDGKKYSDRLTNYPGGK